MDGSLVNANYLISLYNGPSLPDDITSQSQVTKIQNDALIELSIHLKNRDHTLLLSYLKSFLAINSDIHWNLHKQFNIDSVELLNIILANADKEVKSRIRDHFAVKLDDKTTRMTDLILFLSTISTEDDTSITEIDKELLSYYCNLNQNYDEDDDYLKNVYMKKITLLEEHFSGLKTSNKGELLKLIPFIEEQFKEKADSCDFIGKKCYLCGLALSVITKEYYEQFDLTVLFTSFNLTELIHEYKIIEFTLAIQFYKQFFNTVVKRKSLYRFLKVEMKEVISELVQILATANEFSIIETYAKSFIFEILNKVSILDGGLLNSLLVENGINLKCDSDYKYLLDFYSFLNPDFIEKYYSQEIKRIYSIQNFSINVYSQIPVMRNICSNEKLWQLVVEPVLPICKSLPLLEKLVLLEKFTQYKHCLNTLLKQENWLFQFLFIDVRDEELITLKENTYNNLIIKNGEFVRETDPVFHQKLKAAILGNDREAKVSIATMTQ